ncbi:MAG: rod-binding protein [Bacteriovoracia bacterium]
MPGPIAPGRQLPVPTVNSMPAPAQTDARTPMNRVMGKIDRSRLDPQIVKASEGMEAMFLDYMMSAMRKTVPDNDMSMDNSATKIYQSMLDSDVAQRAAKQGGVGLADQVIAYLVSNSYNQKMGPSGSRAPVAAARVQEVPDESNE